MEKEETGQRQSGIFCFFEGATIHNLVIKSGTDNHYKSRDNTEKQSYSDRQIAKAIESINGEGKPLDTSRLWAAVYWYLRWNCNYPVRAMDFCERIAKLPFTKQLTPECKYENIRKYVTMTFMNQDVRNLDAVKPNKTDESFFAQCREVVLALKTELEKIDYPEVVLFPN